MDTQTPGPDAAPAPTPAAQWRRASTDGELYTLPGSGHTALLRRPSLTALAGAGAIPNPLSDAVLRLVLSRPATTEDERLANFRANARGFVEVAARCLVSPPMALDRAPDDGEIGPNDLADLDYTWLFYEFVEGAAAARATFRAGRAPVEPGGLPDA